MMERYRERRAFALAETVAQDVRYALRTLRRCPGFTTTSVAVLALAIGANTSMFSVLNAVLLRPLPYRSPDQLTMLWTSRPGQNVREGRSAYWNFEMWRRESKSFADMAVFDGVSVTLTGTNEAEQISVARVSPNFFPLLGVQPFQGRSFSDEDVPPGLSASFRTVSSLRGSMRMCGSRTRCFRIGKPAAVCVAQIPGSSWEDFVRT
jgi:putative ABC transport system permease protein